MTSSPTSSRTLLRKIHKGRVFRVAVIGQDGVGKSALTVRFVTRRFIGDYDPATEKIYTCTKTIMGLPEEFEILDTAGWNVSRKLKSHVKWCDAVVLLYSVTDRCSFNEARRLSFLITAGLRRRHKTGSDPVQEVTSMALGLPVSLVGNMADREEERMISKVEGLRLAEELGCTAFRELSVREDIDPVIEVFEGLFLAHRRRHNFKWSAGSRRDRAATVSHTSQSQSKPPCLALQRLCLESHGSPAVENPPTGFRSGDSEAAVGGGSRAVEDGQKGSPPASLEPASPPAFRSRRRETLMA